MAITHRRSMSGVKLGENSHSSSFSARERIANEKFLKDEKKMSRLKKCPHGVKYPKTGVTECQDCQQIMGENSGGA